MLWLYDFLRLPTRGMEKDEEDSCEEDKWGKKGSFILQWVHIISLKRLASLWSKTAALIPSTGVRHPCETGENIYIDVHLGWVYADTK